MLIYEKYTTEMLVRLVQMLLQSDTEQPWFDFKRNHLSPERIGLYLSGLSNSACACRRPNGYLVFGIDDTTHEVVGTDFDPLKEREKGEPLVWWLQKGLKPRISFDCFPIEFQGKRIVVVEVAAASERPTKFFGKGMARIGSSLTELENAPDVEKAIFRAMMDDWTGRTVPGVGLEALDANALKIARQKFYEKHSEDSFATEISTWDDWTFLNNAKLSVDGMLTYASLILIGKETSAHWLSPATAKVTWNYVSEEGDIRDYRHFGPPFITVADRVWQKIRNVTLRRMIGDDISPTETPQYDPWVFHELIHNCIAHQDYSIGANIVVSEFVNRLQFSNAGDFAPGTIKAALNYSGAYRRYANKQLAEAMVELKMIDTIGSGIRKIFTIQEKNAMPAPKYTFPKCEIRVVLKGVPDNLTGLEPAQRKMLGVKDADEQIALADKTARIEKIIELMRDNPSITLSAILSAIGGGKRSVEREVAALRKAGRIVREGGRKQGRWRVVIP